MPSLCRVSVSCLVPSLCYRPVSIAKRILSCPGLSAPLPCPQQLPNFAWQKQPLRCICTATSPPSHTFTTPHPLPPPPPSILAANQPVAIGICTSAYSPSSHSHALFYSAIRTRIDIDILPPSSVESIDTVSRHPPPSIHISARLDRRDHRLHKINKKWARFMQGTIDHLVPFSLLLLPRTL